MKKKFLIYFWFKNPVIIQTIEGQFEIEAEDEKEAKELENKILDSFGEKIKVEEVKIADKSTGYFLS